MVVFVLQRRSTAHRGRDGPLCASGRARCPCAADGQAGKDNEDIRRPWLGGGRGARGGESCGYTSNAAVDADFATGAGRLLKRAAASGFGTAHASGEDDGSAGDFFV